jgi:hypothetical protein
MSKKGFMGIFKLFRLIQYSQIFILVESLTQPEVNGHYIMFRTV